MPACIHYVHVGWIGVMANLRYMQAPDFVLGLLCIDLALDDGRQIGRWPWQRRRGAEQAQPEPAPPGDATWP